jgi:SecD/SecF fusion protein
MSSWLKRTLTKHLKERVKCQKIRSIFPHTTSRIALYDFLLLRIERYDYSFFLIKRYTPMKKQQRWQLAIILTVLVWTLYNIFPTILYYSRPLARSIDEKDATRIEEDISQRINALTPEAVEWIQGFCRMVGVHPTNITVNPADPSAIAFDVASPEEAAIIQKFLPHAGMLVPFMPSQIFLDNVNGKTIQVSRRFGLTIGPKQIGSYFQFIWKHTPKGLPTEGYCEIVYPRFIEVAYATSGPSPLSEMLDSALDNNNQAVEGLATEIAEWESALGSVDGLTTRLLHSLFQGPHAQANLDALAVKFTHEAGKLKTEIDAAHVKQKASAAEGIVVDPATTNAEREQTNRMHRYQRAADWLNAHKGAIDKTETPYSRAELSAWLQTTPKTANQTVRLLNLGDRHPLIGTVKLDWTEDQIQLVLHNDVAHILSGPAPTTEASARLKDTVSRMVMNEIARISRRTNEPFKGEETTYASALSQSPSSQGLITLKLNAVATSMLSSILDEINNQWQPTSLDLSTEALPRLTSEQYVASTPDVQKLCLFTVAPTANQALFSDLKPGSLYIIIKGGSTLLDYAKAEGEASTVQKDLSDLATILQRHGFVAYQGKILGASSEFANDIIFELDRFYDLLLEATREAFYVPGVSDRAMLECGTWEQRILAENRIDDGYQDELIKWREAWQASQVSLHPADRFSIVKPTKSVFWSNLRRSWNKYWRGDETRVIRWGLDLSGGKSVRVGLLDQANRQVVKTEDLKQATSELYSRLNKMGVSERTLRIENGTILIDFPGVRGVSASELVKASAMYFHVANEKFGPFNPDLAKQSQAFLQEVWNEAVVSNSKDSESINRIALRKVHAVESGLATDDSIKALLDAGLVLGDPTSPPPSTAFDDHVSIIARWSGDDPSEWPSHNNPLMIVFKNYGLEGCNLENVHPSYDPSKGNILVFGVKSSDSRKSDDSPRDQFYTWTSQFSEDGIQGTPREQYSRGRGWRMAVILNGYIINAPALSTGLRDSAMITGNFTQREVQNLATNLQAGSLSFTPKILLEQNVSPELGARERSQGLVAAALSVIAVVVIMVAYYRFAGAIASIAVVFNLLIIWAVMQNIEAAVTLPAIAGIVLTVAMAVDANVLVFERIREEFSISSRISSAIARGYEKAFSAIVDSNLTTLLAAFILTQFDCGPVRGFAMVLIIGLTSSMFTSLFVTKYYFTRWAEKPAHTALSMANWIRSKDFDFLSWQKVSYLLSFVILVIGIAVSCFTWRSMLGMDFTGGYALVLEAAGSPQGVSPREAAVKALEGKGVNSSEIQIRELGRKTALRIQLSSSLDQPGRPFHDLPEVSPEQATTYDYQQIPRLKWVVDSLESGGVTLRPADRTSLVQQWTTISGQFSDAMRNNALLALSLAIVGILIYIAIRFEWKYAVSAVLALIHDVLLTLAVIAILRLFGLPVQINLEVIGALMTIIGYSLNDTIIVFDRVREDFSLYKKKRFSAIVNMALNSTLSRTLLTSGITLIVLLCLVLLGGASIFGFSFVMFTGVFLGTLSSLFIAGPLLVFFHHREDAAS